MTDGRMVEVATIGNEGMVGVTVFLAARSPRARLFIQVAGWQWSGDGGGRLQKRSWIAWRRF
jgi:hypothetical protein